jgi:hypothetical protein
MAELHAALAALVAKASASIGSERRMVLVNFRQLRTILLAKAVKQIAASKLSFSLAAGSTRMLRSARWKVTPTIVSGKPALVIT